jgi:lipopolysaccharide/colanic/teichoic acid biosynthesis glycosyltransferase
MGSIIKEIIYTQERVGKDGVVFSILNSEYEE